MSDLSREVARAVAALPPASVDLFDWDTAARCALAGTGTREQVARVLGTGLLAERRQQLGLAAVFIALRRAGWANTDWAFNVLAFPPDECPPECCTVWLASAFAWQALAPADLERHAVQTGLSAGEVGARRRNGQEVALIAADPAALRLRRRVWIDDGACWLPSPEVGQIAHELTMPLRRAEQLLGGDLQSLVDETGYAARPEAKPEWTLLDLARLVDARTATLGGVGAWSDPVNKRHAPAEMSGMWRGRTPDTSPSQGVFDRAL
jgi:hypothetical protein